MSINDVYQIWLEDKETPDQMKLTEQAAKAAGLNYTVWTWPMLAEKFGEFSFAESPSVHPELRLLAFIEQFYTWHLLADKACIVVHHLQKTDFAFCEHIKDADIYLGGAFTVTPTSIVASANTDSAALIRNSILAQYERNKDLLSFAKASTLAPLTGIPTYQRIILPCLRYNHIPYVELHKPNDVLGNTFTSHDTLKPKTSSVPKKVIETAATQPKEEKVAEAQAKPQEEKHFYAEGTLPPFWIPEKTRRIIIITNDFDQVETFSFKLGDCIIHINEARHASFLEQNTLASHILFIDAYPRTLRRMPGNMKPFRNIVLYHTNAQATWKEEAYAEYNVAPSIATCLAYEFKKQYNDLKVIVLGVGLTRESTGVAGGCRIAEKKFLSSIGVQTAGAKYRCMFLFLQQDEDLIQDKLQNIPYDCIYKYVGPKTIEDAGAYVLESEGCPNDVYGIKNAVQQALGWNWDWLYVGTTLHVDDIPNMLDSIKLWEHDTFGHTTEVRSHRKFSYTYSLYNGFFVKRTAVKDLVLNEENKTGIPVLSSCESHYGSSNAIIEV